jgi:uncharacterized protein with beta-barrel porin domain
MKNLKILFKPKTGLAKLAKKVASYLAATVIFSTSFTGIASAGAVNQGTSAKNTFEDGDNITLTGATAITVLAADDQLTNMINTDGTAAVLTLSGGNKLTFSGATFSVKGTDGESIGITMTGTGTGIILGEATLGTVTLLGAAGTSVDVTGADTHTLTFDGSAAFAGTLEVSGTSTFSGAIGGTNGLAAINVDNTKTATFSEAVKATTLTGTGDTVFKKAFTGTTISLAGGKVTFNNTDAVSTAANITEASGSTELAVLNSADAEAPSVATFTGDITVDTITIGATATGGSANVTGTSAGALTVHGGDAAAEDSKYETESTHTGAVVLTQAGSGDAIFELGGTTSEVVGAITATSDGDGGFIASATTSATFDAIGTASNKLLTGSVASGATATFGAAVSANTLTFTGTATLQENNNASEKIVLADGAILHLDKTIVNGETVFNEVATTAPDIDAGAKIYMPVNLTFGQTLTMFAGEGDATIGDAVGNDTELDATMQDTALIDYDAALVATDNGSTLVTANAKTASTTATELSVTKNEAIALKQAYTAAINTTVTDTTAEEAFDNGLNAINGFSATEDSALAKQVAPQTDLISGSSVAAQAVTGSVQGIMSNRMASLRSGDAYFGTGVAAGGMSAQSGFIQVFGSTAEQNNTTVGSGTQYGYESDTEGLAIGFDGVTDDGMTIGVSLALATTDVDGKGTGKSTNSIDTQSASLYMDRATDAGYIEGSVTYGMNKNTTSRKVTSAGLDRTYSGSYDSQSLSINISAGSPIDSGSGYLTPFGSFTASFMDIDAYTESSTVANDSLRLKVAQDDVNSMIGTVGIKYHAEMGNGGTPMISLAINNEFGDATIDSTNTYQGGGTPFKTSTAVEELSATLGLGYSYGSDAASIEFAYEADANDDDYLSHYGSIKVVGKF